MYSLIKQLFKLLTIDQRRRFYSLQVLVIIMTITELIALGSVIPFMTLVGDSSYLQQDNFINMLYKTSGITSESKFIFITGMGVIFLLFISMLISIITTWKLSMFATNVGAEISSRLYRYYLSQEWMFHVSGSSSELTKKIANESSRVTTGVIMPLMQVNTRILLTIFISSALIYYDPIIAAIGIAMFIFIYFIMFKIVRVRIQDNGNTISKAIGQRFKLMNEGFGGIKDILLLGNDRYFINQFNKTSRRLAYSVGANSVFSQVPRYIIELIAFGSMISIVLYLIGTHNSNIGIVLPIITIYALATFKLLPAFQNIYANFATIKGNISAFKSIESDLANSYLDLYKSSKINENCISPKKNISLTDVSFTYPSREGPALNKINLTINTNSTIGIVGPSGSGKSTLINMLLGLIKPDEGHFKIDDLNISSENIRLWQNNVGYVAQSIFLSEGTIAENIAFGIPSEHINHSRLHHAVKLAHLDELINNLKDGIDTQVGERGVQISGGQLQRIGIARALYREAEVIMFDEATSSLDGITETMIMDAIHEFGGKKTIIMIAHRLQTVKECDKIFFMNKGQITDQGTFQILSESNKDFNNLASKI